MAYLLEPTGFAFGDAARALIQSGHGLPLCGGPSVFTFAELYKGREKCGLVPVGHIPAPWHQARDQLVRLPPSPRCLPARSPCIMGIVNVTPDSFSSRGAQVTTQHALHTARSMIAHGASLLDIGGESTRPGAQEVPPDEEWARIKPVIVALRRDFPHVPLSVDTRHSYVMARALEAGVAIINDVSALRHDAHSLEIIARSGCGVILMHMRGNPQTMQSHVGYHNVAVDVVEELACNVERALKAGIRREQICLDPGFGFAKTAQQNEALLRHSLLLANLGMRIVCGVSRKRFLGVITGQREAHERDVASVVASTMLLGLGNPIMRVHNVEAMDQALAVCRHIYGR